MQHFGTVLSVSSSDYTVEKGGVNKVIYSHQIMMNNEGFDYLYVYPVSQLTKNQLFCWHVIKNGKKEKKSYTHKELIDDLVKNEKITNIFIHHFMRLEVKFISSFFDCFPEVPGFYYIHDYYAICSQYNLLKNGEQFCNVGWINNKCDGCRFREEKLNRKERFEEFFLMHKNVCAIAPSDTAKEVWLKAYPFMQERIKVIYHQRLFGKYYGNKEEIRDRKVNIAFVGTCGRQKGWNDWIKLVNRLEKTANGQYKFWVFGNPKEKHSGMTYIHVNATNNVNSMVDNLRKENIDVVFLGSIWPETYAYTYYEAFASNAFILANRLGGNIPVQVKAHDNGIVYSEIEELLVMLENYTIFLNLLNKFRKSEVCGPAILEENNQIIDLMNKEVKTNKYSEVYEKEHASVALKLLSSIDRTDLGRKILLRLGSK